MSVHICNEVCVGMCLHTFADLLGVSQLRLGCLHMYSRCQSSSLGNDCFLLVLCCLCVQANGLEQFCINWTAESLNRHFCASTFSTMYEECQLDGVDPLIECDVYDSVPCLDLLGNHVS